MDWRAQKLVSGYTNVHGWPINNTKAFEVDAHLVHWPVLSAVSGGGGHAQIQN